MAPRKRPYKPTRRAFSPEDIERIKRMSGQGLTALQVAHCLGISRENLYQRLRGTPGAGVHTLKEARDTALEAVTQTAYRLAVSGKQPVFTMFWLKCRAQWREKDRGVDVNVQQHQQQVTTIAPEMLNSILQSVDQLITERTQWSQATQAIAPQSTPQDTAMVEVLPISDRGRSK